jgi:5'-nucleotidase
VLQLEFTDAATQRPFKIVDAEHVEISASIREDPDVKGFVDECCSKVGSAMDKVIGDTAVDLDSRFASIRTRETNIGNFIADVMCKGLDADLAVINSGTIRADAIIEKGPIKMRDLVNLLPMLDELCLLQLTGSQVMAVLENSVSQYPRLEGRFAQVSGVTFTYDASKASGTRVLRTSVMVKGEALVMDKKYRLCTKDYLRQGKDGYDVFKDSVCLADGEQAGILPTMVREYFLQVTTLNGDTECAPVSSTRRASAALAEAGLAKIGAGPEPLKRYAIEPKVEGRIVCMNPVDI